MKSNYKKLGPYIREVVVKNTDLKIKKLLGVSITKRFITSIANTIGTDMSKYKIVRTKQFAYGPVTSRNGEKISVALLEENDCIMSTSYTAFEITDVDELDPEYLMMWFRRQEFDRYARYMSHGSVREIFGWEEMCDVELPIPHIDKQREIVREYNVIVDRIKLNEQLNKKLEETTQAIYKQWFVDFEFPISKEYAESIGKPELKGEPYKSSGGEMVWNDELDQEIPKEWMDGTLETFSELIDGDRGKNYPSQNDFSDLGYCLFLNTGNVTKNGFQFSLTSFISEEKDEALRKGKLKLYDSVLTTRGTVGNVAYFSDEIEYKNIRVNSGMLIVRPLTKDAYPDFNYQLLKSPIMKNAIVNYLSGSAQPQLPIKDLRRIKMLKPEDEYINKSMKLVAPLQKCIDVHNKTIRSLHVLHSIFLAKITKVSI